MSIEKLIEKSFNDLIKALTTDGTSSQLIFPHSNNGNERRSEQELRQIFLRNVEEDKTYFYSVETPTKYAYCFKNSENPIVKEEHEKGDNHKSARFDVSLYNKDYKVNDNILNHIEFKYGNPDQQNAICKDFLKLVSEVDLTKEKKNFFVHYLCVEDKNSWELTSFKSIFRKYRKSVDYIENLLKNQIDLKNVFVYLLCFFETSKSGSTYHFSLNDLKNYTVGTTYSDLTDKSWLNEKIFNTENYI